MREKIKEHNKATDRKKGTEGQEKHWENDLVFENFVPVAAKPEHPSTSISVRTHEYLMHFSFGAYTSFGFLLPRVLICIGSVNSKSIDRSNSSHPSLSSQDHGCTTESSADQIGPGNWIRCLQYWKNTAPQAPSSSFSSFRLPGTPLSRVRATCRFWEPPR